MGGHNAIACAAWHPDRIRGLVIVDSRPAIPAERLAQMKERGVRPPRRHPTVEAAVATFRLLPPETGADPALLAHLARESVAWRDGAVSLRFDPACYAARVPVDGWPLLPRITAPDARGPGRAEPDPPAPDGRAPSRRAARAPGWSRYPDAYHHLVLDRPDAFVRELRGFLDDLDGSGIGAAAPRPAGRGGLVTEARP